MFTLGRGRATWAWMMGAVAHAVCYVQGADCAAEGLAARMIFPDGPGLQAAASEHACSVSLMRLACVGLPSMPQRAQPQRAAATPRGGGAWLQLQPLARVRPCSARCGALAL